MVASPFGSKVHLRTHLSEAECLRRLEEYLPASLWDAGFGDVPVAIYKWQRIEVWDQHEPNSAKLVAKLKSGAGGTEIIGRAGGNTVLFLVCVAASALILFGAVFDTEIDQSLWVSMSFALIAPLAIYLLKRDSPHGEHLIDFLQEVLEAEDLTERKGDPIRRS